MICAVCGKEYEKWKEDDLLHILCKECDQKYQEELKQIQELEKQGHSPHCARRQVWGDGECECRKEG